MNWGLPVDSDIGDFVRDENNCHQCAVSGEVLEQCAKTDHDQSPVTIDTLMKLGWNQETCTQFYFGNLTSGSDYEDMYEPGQGSESALVLGTK